MFLSKFIIINYRSCKTVDLDFQKDLPNVMVGINDGGKTTILRAIGLLFGDKYSFNYKTGDSFRCDVSNTQLDENTYNQIFEKYSLPTFEYDGNDVTLLAKFEIEENEIDEDKISISNQLLWCLENSPTFFWLCKVYSNNDSTEKLHILIDDTMENLGLWNLSDDDLNKKIKEYSVTKKDIENRNRTGRYKKIEKVRAIYSKTTLSKSWKEYNKGYKTDKELFPKYRYLDWNMNLNDLNNLVSDTMASIVDSYKSQAQENINTLSTTTEREINNELRQLKNALFEDIPNIEEIQAKFRFQLTDEIRDILIKKSNTDEFVHIELQGEGVKRRIWFAFIKWNAQKSLELTDSLKKFIWCFDEPETHLYPAAQRGFFDLLKTLTRANVQTIISTHSTIFTDKSKFETIKDVNLEDKYTVVTSCSTTEDVFNSLQMKNSDFLFFDKFLAVEGDTEEVLIPHLYKIYFNRDLMEDGIQLIKLNSKSNKINNYRILEQILKDFKKPESCIYYILDNDSKYDEPNLISKTNVKLIGRQDIEDSIVDEVWLNILQMEYNLDTLISINDIQTIKNSIPNDQRANKDEKFYKKLNIITRRKKAEQTGEQIDYDVLPDKGKSIGELLIRYINNINQLDPKIKEAFDQI